MKEKTKRILSLAMCAAVGVTACCSLAGCKNTVDALVLMSEEVDGLFNPFYATTGADMEVVGMTQISMLTSGYEGNGNNATATVAYGDNEAVVVKDYGIEKIDETAPGKQDDKTKYTFIIKNGITFSDGVPLTMNDVLFNMYVYLDPVYTGSTTMYSTDIVGLEKYRTQSTSDDQDTWATSQAYSRANSRITELINTYMAKNIALGNSATSPDVTEDEMREAIAARNLSEAYKSAISNDSSSVTNAQLLADYELVLKYFKEELESDYISAKESYLEEPYKSAKVYANAAATSPVATGFDEVTSFMYAEGFVEIEYEKKTVEGKETDDRSKIKKVIRNYNSEIDTQEEAINHVYNSKVSSSLTEILTYWGTAQKLLTEFSAKAKEVVLHENLPDGQLAFPNIEGIKSLGHDDTFTGTTVTVNHGDVNNTTDTETYKVAKSYNANGTVANPEDEYAVLEITINGTDPKAIWNFAFTVAPAHYYAHGYIENNPIDIKNNKFGVAWGSFDYMKSVIQSSRNVGVPMGAGPYIATDVNLKDNPESNEFRRNNVIYYKANENFILGAPKTKRVNYQIVSTNNALIALEGGSVHFVTPQFTKDNAAKLTSENGGGSLYKKGMRSTSSMQLGYGYIGINAGKVPNINIRKAIMAAMNTKLALEYYQAGTVKQIFWPMSMVNWAYPCDKNGNPITDNGHNYTMFTSDDQAKANIKTFMQAAGVSEGSSQLKIKFTIAGSNLNDHPTFKVFNHAATLLNECGWNIEVVPDTQALSKLSTGALSVWAAAWGSTIDPDMYQVYHKNSTATSTVAWGYREIKNSPSTYTAETTILTKLSDLIDDAREIDFEDDIVDGQGNVLQKGRKTLYKEAMSLVLDLAIELPVYQRNVLYAYNGNIIDQNTLPSVVNPYTSPMAKLWEVAMNK